MFRFALKNMAVKKGKLLLVLLSIMLSATVALLAYNVSMQVQDGIVNTAAYYDIIIGPSGSSTQLAMNTMFFTDTPLGTVSYDLVEELQANPDVNEVVPFTMGDSFNNAKIVGTTSAFLNGKSLRAGEMFDDTYEAVVGAAVADNYGLSVGDTLVTSHGLSGHGSSHESAPLTVVGILDESHTAYDNTVFTTYQTVWAVHGLEHHDHDEEGEEDHTEEGHTEEDHDEEGHTEEDHTEEDHAEDDHDAEATATPAHDVTELDDDGHDEEEEGEVHASEGTVCAILVKTKSFNAYYTISEYYAADSSLLVINPSTVLREVLDNVDLSSQIVYILCAIILVMNLFVISVITLLNLYDAKKEISLMRLIGVGMRKISMLFLIQNGIVGILSTILAFGASMLCMSIMSDFVAAMGIVLNATKTYPLEWAIMAIVFVISVLPTFVATLSMARKDSLESK